MSMAHRPPDTSHKRRVRVTKKALVTFRDLTGSAHIARPDEDLMNLIDEMIRVVEPAHVVVDDHHPDETTRAYELAHEGQSRFAVVRDGVCVTMLVPAIVARNLESGAWKIGAHWTDQRAGEPKAMGGPRDPVVEHRRPVSLMPLVAEKMIGVKNDRRDPSSPDPMELAEKEKARAQANLELARVEEAMRDANRTAERVFPPMSTASAASTPSLREELVSPIPLPLAAHGVAMVEAHIAVAHARLALAKAEAVHNAAIDRYMELHDEMTKAVDTAIAEGADR